MQGNIVKNSGATSTHSSFSGTPAQFRNLLGHGVVLLGWPLRSKGTRKKWGNLTAADMTPEYLKRLERGNLGVALGRVSGGLVAVDIDDDRLVKPFLDANPSLKATLRTHGARGEVFWLQMRGKYPAKTVMLKTHRGEDAGEWRAGTGTQSIIAGIHPETRKPYEVVNLAKPLEVDFASIVWPAQISNPPKVEDQLPMSGTEDTEDTEDTDETDEVGVWVFAVRSVEDVLRVSVPTAAHQNYRAALTLARGVKALEAQAGKLFTPDQHRDIHKQWLTLSAQFLRPGQTHEEYFMEYLNAYKLAKYPLGSMAVAKALEAAKKNPLPPSALCWTANPELRLLVAICRELQDIAGEEPFYLSARTVQHLFKHPTHSTGAKWLRSLCVMQILEEVQKGTGMRATRYHYRLTM